MPALDLSLDIAAFQTEKARLLREFGRQWVVLADAKFQAAFADFDAAARFALSAFGNRPFLIRRADDPQAAVPMMIVDDPH
jgi:hypothetical protein